MKIAQNIRTEKLLKPTDIEQPILSPLCSLAECGEIFDSMADIVEDDIGFQYKMEMVGITLEDGWIMPIVVILN